jgi:predicted DNA-binding transcriptional regulator AlpA
MVERLLSVHDVSGLTGWSPLTIYKKAAAGLIPGRVTIGKRSLRFKQSEVSMWLQRVSSDKAGLANETGTR